MKHYQVHFKPDDVTAIVHAGATLLEAAGQAGIILANPCGGIGRCGKCKVQLLPSGKEVLACQFRIDHNLTVQVPDSSRFFLQKILEQGTEHHTLAEPAILKIFIDTPPASIDDFCELLSDKIQLPFTLQDSINTQAAESLNLWRKTGVTVIFALSSVGNDKPTYRVTGFETGNTTDVLYGIAVDIGTTTIVAHLLDLNTGRRAATVSACNPQSQYGADVISRIGYAETDEGLLQLHRSVIDCLNELIHKAATAGSIDCSCIYEIAVVGNTTMNHLFLNYPVKQLGQAPYRPYSLLAADRSPSQLQITINPAGNIHTAANIAGFIGSDTVASVLACKMEAASENILLVDIGTNGEIVLAASGHLLAASCAAGPALEGAGIEFGSRAQKGAIERVLYDGCDIYVDVIESDTALTICGSGLIDAAAVLLEADIIESSGQFRTPETLSPFTAPSIRNRLIAYKGKPAFVLAGTYKNQQWKNPVLLTQKDIRQLQLAKAAIRTGIELLLKEAKIDAENIGKVLLAGAFGNYIQKDSAVRIGLLPPIPLEKIHFVGNAAGTGAEMILISSQMRQQAVRLAQSICYVEIARQNSFQSVFGESLLFPEK
ncbi:MAG: DUF4445 domain-containing protein [Phycisphaerae bacterium]|nr:DUF4445 domain-containing protein [Phycisphaerae bacterium]